MTSYYPIVYAIFSPVDVTYRIADELPWITKQLGDKEGLKKAILNLCVFVKLYGRYGRRVTEGINSIQPFPHAEGIYI